MVAVYDDAERRRRRLTGVGLEWELLASAVSLG
jgi:hypothetical protein